jgi:hypothetical protein
VVQRRKLNVKFLFESSLPHFSFKRIVPGAFNSDLIGATCTVLPRPSGSTDFRVMPQDMNRLRPTPVYRAPHSSRFSAQHF